MHDGWTFDWLWSVLLIVFTMIIHVLVLGRAFRLIIEAHDKSKQSGQGAWMRASIFVIAFTLVAIVLHAIEGACWGMAYHLLGALPTRHSAILYSLNAMTTFGHVTFDLSERWKLMGALEALNGILLFGLTTAFMFALLVQLNFASEARRM